MAVVTALGRWFNVMPTASGVHIRMRHGTAVTFASLVGAGNQVLTLKESTDGSGEQALSIIDEVYKGPGTGGTWTKVTQTASDTFTNADATNDAVVFTVRADALSDTFDSVECTTSVGQLFALVHPMNVAVDPSSLESLLTA